MLFSVLNDRSGLAYSNTLRLRRGCRSGARVLFRAMSAKPDGTANPLQGVPRQLHLDNGPVAKSAVFKRVKESPNVIVTPHLPGDCQAVLSILSRVGDKWTVLIVMTLARGPRRFNELKRMIGGVSQRMLTLTLRGLERDGIVRRTIYPTIPPRVDYELTALANRCASRSMRSATGHSRISRSSSRPAAFDARSEAMLN